MEWALVNGDYEFELFRDEVGETPVERINKNRNDVEFVFFYLNQNKNLGLSSTQKYEDSFFERLASLGFTVPSVGDHPGAIPWYGKLHDIPKEKCLNSKLWSYELLNQLKLNPCENHVVENREQAISLLASKAPTTWLLKSPYFMSGVGFNVAKNASDIPHISHPHILEPYLERIVEISYHYNYQDKSTYYYLNKASQIGQYIGGSIFEDPKGLEDFMRSLNLQPQFRQFKEASLLVIDKLKAENLEQAVSVDGFIYSENGSPRVHPLCDVNYRQSMGALLVNLKRLLPKNGFGEFYILNKMQKLQSQDFMPYSPLNRKGVVYLTHKHAPNLAVFICGTDPEEVGLLRKKFFLHGS